ncbi:MAG: hypothetical protein NT075_05555 [Chloroflexi bacterium]|nr:hypothetical protein [Chloroflexota bacterium]
MRQARAMLSGFFLLLILFVVVDHSNQTVWARSASEKQMLAPDAQAATPDENVPDDPLAVPEMRVGDIPVAYHDELAISHSISLTYKTRGLGDPIENQLVIQSKAADGSLVQIGPENWVRTASKTYDLVPSFFPGAIEVTTLSSLQPISWTGKIGIWAVNATNTGVNLVAAAKQPITTELTVGNPFTNAVASTNTYTFTMKASTKIGAQWGAIYPTRFSVYNGCADASWLQNLSSRDKFAMTVPLGSVTSVGAAPWDMRQMDGTGVIVASGTIVGPICGSAQNAPPVGTFTPIFLYLPAILR